MPIFIASWDIFPKINILVVVPKHFRAVRFVKPFCIKTFSSSPRASRLEKDMTTIQTVKIGNVSISGLQMISGRQFRKS